MPKPHKAAIKDRIPAPVSMFIFRGAAEPPLPGGKSAADILGLVPDPAAAVTATATVTPPPPPATGFADILVAVDGPTAQVFATAAQAAPNAFADILAAAPGPVAAVTATAVTVAPAGIPTSADYLPKAQDPRAAQPYGSSSGYSAMKRLANGDMIVFGMSHTPSENNAVCTYRPSTNAWTVRIPHTIGTWADGQDVSGRTYLGNRDNQVNLVVRSGAQYWVMEGERGITLTGNYRGVVDTTNWTWSSINDDYAHFQPTNDQPVHIWNGVGEWIDSLNVGVIYGGTSNNPGDWLQIFVPSGGSFTRLVYGNIWWSESFPGAQLLRYVSQSNWTRSGKIHIYGGVIADRATLAQSPNYTIWQLDVSNTAAPVMTSVSVNTLGASVRVQGDAVLGDYYAAKDMAVVTDGINCNVYDYGGQTGLAPAWYNVPINTAPDVNRQSPQITGQAAGTGLQCRWAPEVDQLIVLGINGFTYGVRLNFGAAPPPVPNAPTISGFAGTPPAVQTGSTSSLNATVTGATTMRLDGASIASLPVTVTPPVTHVYTLDATNSSGTTTATATVTVSPAIPPPPGITPGSLLLSTQAVPYVGPAVVLGSSKHLDFARVGTRWYKTAGDHASAATPVNAITPALDQGGNQQIYSVNIPLNDWREDQPYYVPIGGNYSATDVQGCDPDDAGVIARNGEIWQFVSDTNHQIQQPAGAILQTGQGIGLPIGQFTNLMAWTPPTVNKPFGTWRIAGPWPNIIGSNRFWRGYYDPVTDKFILIVTSGGELVWGIINGATGADETAYVSPGVPVTYGAGYFTTAGCAADFVARKVYLYDITDMRLVVANMDNLQAGFTLIGTLPDVPTGTQAITKMCFHATKRCVVIASGPAVKLHAYEVDPGKLTTWPRQDGYVSSTGVYVPASTLFYDPDTQKIVFMGGIDFDHETFYAPNYWLSTIT